MAPIKIKHIISFSSSDGKNSVENILSCFQGNSKWLCSSGDKTSKLEGIFQFENPCRISHLDIGTHWVFSVQVFVGRSSWPVTQDFPSLIPMTTYTSPIDSRQGKNLSCMKMYTSDDFPEDVRHEMWDRIKIVLTQPFRKDSQFGLSLFKMVSYDKFEMHESSVDPNLSKCNSNKTPNPKAISTDEIKEKFFPTKHRNKLESVKANVVKIGASSENCTEQTVAVSRNAKLIMAAASKTPVYKTSPKTTPQRKKKHIVPFSQEILQYLGTIDIKELDLEKTTYADLRHGMEKKKCRKLSKDERTKFMDHVQVFIQKVVSISPDSNIRFISHNELKELNFEKKGEFGNNDKFESSKNKNSDNNIQPLSCVENKMKSPNDKSHPLHDSAPLEKEGKNEVDKHVTSLKLDKVKPSEQAPKTPIVKSKPSDGKLEAPLKKCGKPAASFDSILSQIDDFNSHRSPSVKRKTPMKSKSPKRNDISSRNDTPFKRRKSVTDSDHSVVRKLPSISENSLSKLHKHKSDPDDSASNISFQNNVHTKHSHKNDSSLRNDINKKHKKSSNDFDMTSMNSSHLKHTVKKTYESDTCLNDSLNPKKDMPSDITKCNANGIGTTPSFHESNFILDNSFEDYAISDYSRIGKSSSVEINTFKKDDLISASTEINFNLENSFDDGLISSRFSTSPESTPQKFISSKEENNNHPVSVELFVGNASESKPVRRSKIKYTAKKYINSNDYQNNLPSNIQNNNDSLQIDSFTSPSNQSREMSSNNQGNITDEFSLLIPCPICKAKFSGDYIQEHAAECSTATVSISDESETDEVMESFKVVSKTSLSTYQDRSFHQALGSSVVNCPVCNEQYPASIIDHHVNFCIDNS